MGGFGKAAGIGLASVLALLLLMSASGIVYAATVLGTFTIEIPKAEINNLFMYPDTYDNSGAIVMTQEIEHLNAWKGQEIRWFENVAGVPIAAVISMDYADMKNLVVKGYSIFSPAGVYENRPEGITMRLDERHGKTGLYVSNMAMDNLKAVVYQVYLDYLYYGGLSVGIETG